MKTFLEELTELEQKLTDVENRIVALQKEHRDDLHHIPIQLFGTNAAIAVDQARRAIGTALDSVSLIRKQTEFQNAQKAQ